MNQRIRVKPTKPVLVMGLVVAAAMLIQGAEILGEKW